MYTQPGPEDLTQSELLHNLQHGSDKEQEQALDRLASVGEAEALDAVISYLKEHAHEGDFAGLDALRVLANKYLPQDRYGLAESLLPFLTTRNWQQRLYAIRLLSTYPNELAVNSLRDLIDETRDQVHKAPMTRPSSTSRILVERTLKESVLALANSGRLLALPDILEYLEDPLLRVEATRALGIIGTETQRDHLKEELAEDFDPQVRDAAQWALHLMDERAEQFMNPPTDIPTPPPDRLSPLYWAHRKLIASATPLYQFLVVRVGIEHIILDQFVSEGRVPEICTIVMREYEGDAPPNHRNNQAKIVGLWEYHWRGPSLRRRTPPAQKKELTKKLPGANPMARGALMTISYPEHLLQNLNDEGSVSIDSQFQAFFGQGWVYNIFRRDDDSWGFIKQHRTWST